MTTSVDEKRNGHSGLVKQLQSEEELQAFLNAPPVYEPGQEESHEFISSVDERRKKRYGQNGHKNGQPASETNHEVQPLTEAFDFFDLLHEEFPPLQWIIPDLLPEGITLLFSRPKIGKSMLALALMFRFIRESVDDTALYFCLDDRNKRRLQSRTRDVLGGYEITSNRAWGIMSGVERLGSGLTKQLEMWMQDHSLTKLIIIDVFGSIKPKKRNEDIYQGDREAISELQQFAVDHHLAVLLVHHTNKRKEAEDWIDGINGSTGLAGSADALWLLARARGQTDMTLHTTGREVEDMQILLDLADLNGPWRTQLKEGQEDPATARKRILQVFSMVDGDITPKRITELSGLKHNTVLSALRRMRDKGEIFQSTFGSYHTGYRGVEIEIASDTPMNLCNSCDSTPQANSDGKIAKLQEIADNCNFAILPCRTTPQESSQELHKIASDESAILSYRNGYESGNNGQVDHHERKPTKPKPDFDCYQCEALHIEGSTWQWDSNAHNWICTNMARHGRQVILTETEIDVFGPKRK